MRRRVIGAMSIFITANNAVYAVDEHNAYFSNAFIIVFYRDVICISTRIFLF